jgi:hypothetical protein
LIARRASVFTGSVFAVRAVEFVLVLVLRVGGARRVDAGDLELDAD